ncbi:MAG: Orotidine 5-phosphate decarboxylase [Myxococcaceae bacterium]|jgi:orotidine-5'-phosphate decarboxylase|nr:Orotidine 5-phosphate decarboxylase [Myxococcaceae bacterium]
MLINPATNGPVSAVSRLIFALDYPRLEDARDMAVRLGERVGMLKIGLELFVEAGPDALAIARDLGLPIFLDLKLHDIPETVERAVDRAATLGASIVTVHAAGGAEMLRRAARRAETTGVVTIAAVTVLTSLDEGDLGAQGIKGDVPEQTSRLAKIAFEQGVRAFVCSPQEVASMRATLGPEATLITPGVRPSDRAKDDQKRVATPGRAIAEGADYVVVGRPIRDATDPLVAADLIVKEIEAGVKKRSQP